MKQNKYASNNRRALASDSKIRLKSQKNLFQTGKPPKHKKKKFKTRN